MTESRESRFLLLLCAAMYELDFALRLRAGLEARQWRLVVVTHLISVWLKARGEGVPCVLIHRSRRALDAPEIAVETTHEGKLGVLSPRRARRYESCAWAALETACERFPASGVLQWNGQGLAGRVATEFARRRGLATAFVELGNIGGKTFVDPEGVGGAALVARRPDILDRYSVPDEEIAAWRENLIQEGPDNRPIPQARHLGRINPWYPINVLGGAVLGLPAPAAPGLWRRIRTRLGLLRRSQPPWIQPDEPYALFALQVSSDTNLLLFSDLDPLRAFKMAEVRASELGIRLVVKPHPAERDIALMRCLQDRCKSRGHLWTGAPVVPLVLGAEEVITINSTVGLTAKALGRPTLVLGRSVYQHFDARRAAVFALRHLVDIDPFQVTPASQSAVDRILAIMALRADQADANPSSPARRSAIRS